MAAQIKALEAGQDFSPETDTYVILFSDSKMKVAESYAKIPAGSYLATKWSKAKLFSNSSEWTAELEKLKKDTTLIKQFNL